MDIIISAIILLLIQPTSGFVSPSPTTPTIMPICTEKGCNKHCIKQIPSCLCTTHANEQYGQGGVITVGYGKGLRTSYFVGGKAYPPTGKRDSNNRVRYAVPFVACMSQETLVKLSPEEIQAKEDLYNGDPKNSSWGRSRARAKGDPTAEPRRVFRRTDESSRAPGESRKGECAVSGCPRGTQGKVDGISCDCCAVQKFGEWNPETSTFDLTIPGTEYQASITVLYIRENRMPVFSFGDEDFVFLASGHLKEGSSDWESRNVRWLNERASLAARNSLRQSGAPSSGSQPATEAAFLERHQEAAGAGILSRITVDDLSNSSKGLVGGEFLGDDEGLGFLTDSYRNPKVLKVYLKGGKRLGRPITMDDMLIGVLKGTLEYEEHGRGIEQQALDFEKSTHVIMKEKMKLPGRLFTKVGGGQRKGTRTGQFAVLLVRFKGWVPMIREGETIAFSADMSAREKARYCKAFRISPDSNSFVEPDFENHKIRQAYLTERYRQMKVGLISPGESLIGWNPDHIRSSGENHRMAEAALAFLAGDKEEEESDTEDSECLDQKMPAQPSKREPEASNIVSAPSKKPRTANSTINKKKKAKTSAAPSKSKAKPAKAASGGDKSASLRQALQAAKQKSTANAGKKKNGDISSFFKPAPK